MNITDFGPEIINDPARMFELLQALRREVNALRARVATLEAS